ncbi:MAG: single-stranded-DNA-specific exonuclease RecJ [Bacteroidales bacterium]|jgi:single-stranded-DNA-specific exonuclease|nr:single-stranded-DNA-specific exonuclease RecJ [Bacteroidales bacterium]
MDKRWAIKDECSSNESDKLAESLGISTTLAKLLLQRGVKTFDQAKAFFRPTLQDLHDPFLMQDMEVAVERIEKAITTNENIMIYGDYDVDGTTSVAMMYTFLSNYTENTSYYIPDRYEEGYGISYKGIEHAASNNITLIIALDCGIKAVEKIDFALEKGIDFIICDHHLPGEEIPKAVAVLDPKREDCNYPFDQLSGCGVGFKLMQAYCYYKKIPFYNIVPFLDLVSVSIASDIVPIIDENRILAKYGLEQLNKNPRTGLKSIIKTAGLENKRIAIDDIVFKIGPRINAAGRMDTASDAVALLIAKEERQANFMSSRINTVNDERKDVDRQITKEAVDMIDNNEQLRNKASTVLYNPNWHKGVVGIVASRLVETHYKPTIILTNSNGYATGSARSVIGFDLYQAIESCSDLLENFGGHMYAAGLTLKEENIKEFTRRFEEYVQKNITKEQKIPEIEIDTPLNLDEIDGKFWRILKQFEPFGPGNMNPVFVTKNVVDYGEVRAVGATKEHLKLDLVQETGPLSGVPAIGFGLGKYFDDIKSGKAFDVCYTIHENDFRGIVNIQLRIKDIRILEVDEDAYY